MAPVPEFTLRTRHDFTQLPEPVQAPAPPKRKPGPKPRPPGKKPKPPKLTGAARLLSPQYRSILADRLEDAIEDGRVQLCPDDLPCDELDFTTGELRVLAAILFPEDAEAVFAELLERVRKATRR